MKLRELSEQLNRPVNEIVKVLAHKLFIKGVFKPDHEIDDVTVAKVTEVLMKGEITAPALSEGSKKEEKIVEAPQKVNSHAVDVKTRLDQSNQALTAQAIHETTERHQQIVNNQTVYAVLDALTAQTTYNNVFMKTSQVLSESSLKEQQRVAQELLDKIANPDFLGLQTPAESWNLSSKNIASDVLKEDYMNLVK